MEQLLHYTWKHKLFPLKPLQTTDGRDVEIIDPGLANRNAGPDFFNAKIKLDGTLWIGNVEIHQRSSDWYAHNHEKDVHYNNVILHIVGSADTDVYTQDGKQLPQLILPVPAQVEQHYRELLSIDQYPPCYQIIPSLSKLTVHAWMSALQTERLERKTQDINQRVKLCDGSWEAAYFVTLARNYGFGINGEAFEAWAKTIPLHAVDHHRDDLFQIEAIFLGQAGLLDVNTIPEKYQQQAMNEGYFARLRNEYQYLAHKFSLTPIDAQLWRFLRLRPQNFPHIRNAQPANLYYQRKAGLAALLSCTTVKEAQELMKTQVTPYWETHYLFGASPSTLNPQPSTLGKADPSTLNPQPSTLSPSGEVRRGPSLSPFSLNLLMINTVVPMLFAYGRYKGDERLCDRAFDFLEQLKAENNHIVRMWQQCGLEVTNAGDSQALIQLKKEYCDKKDCLRCRIGYEYMKKE